MKGRQVGLVLIVLIVLILTAVVARVVSSGSSEQELTGVRPLSSELMDRVVVSDLLSEATLRKEDGRWMVGSYPVVQWLLDALWETAAQFDGADLVATNPENHPLMGVTPATGSLLQLWTGDQLVEEFMLGDRQFARPEEGGVIISPWSQEARLCYLRRPNQDEVYGVFCAEPDRFIPVGNWWKDPVITKVTPQEIQSVTFVYPDATFRLNKITGIEWMIVNGDEVESNLTKTVDLTERFRQLITEDYPIEEEVAAVDFSRPDASVLFVVEEQESGNVRQVQLLFVRRDDGFYYVKDAENSWAYLLTTTSTSAILRDHDWFLTPLTRPGAPTAP